MILWASLLAGCVGFALGSFCYYCCGVVSVCGLLLGMWVSMGFRFWIGLVLGLGCEFCVTRLIAVFYDLVCFVFVDR